jgi:hypothetical protein
MREGIATVGYARGIVRRRWTIDRAGERKIPFGRIHDEFDEGRGGATPTRRADAEAKREG